ncbi:c-type cytochrome [Fuerstiella marisgermanici]|uniref:Putative heme-binding domain protein n=1 Tax=Fuerstiella marisgermanici TaxID=1891926 RepID=A0A1P8WPX8_9PLAN|nr:c-type cytochrome [Fuerstiella marisgermanici]APZ96110.1 putative heme-binding domain protein [Fuerstiella marisgermanici]
MSPQPTARLIVLLAATYGLPAGLAQTSNQSPEATAKRVFRQTPELQEAMERGAESSATANTKSAPTNPEPQVSDAEFSASPKPQWIWGKDNNSDYVLKTSFTAKDVTAARLKASCDNEGTVFINGRRVAASAAWEEPMSADVAKYIVNGQNTITAKVANHGGIAAFVLELAIKDTGGEVSHVVTNAEWTVDSEDANGDQKVASRGNYGDGPWGDVFSNVSLAGRVPRGVFEVLPGFQVEKLFTVPKDELGSWVCIAFDNKGRLLASDQGDKGICRITLPPVATSSLLPQGGEGARRADEGAARTEHHLTPDLSPAGGEGVPTETTVERLDFSRCEHQPSGAQGMLWAFDSLYFCCNGGPGSGLYRARDTDGDDQFDECVKLKEFKGGGEHGPHSIRLSPDGNRIFVIAGNHTDPPFKPGEELENENYSSRVPTNWGEDLLLPRMWDANGHARGKLAPGGWIASTDPDGKTWEIWSIGYRNPYDMAFNADGELFAYDADMEWDVGTPWYRPTRVVHATSGSEFGWRSGTGKWPEYYIDSLPPLINIGPGSPVGVDFGYGPPREADSEAAKNAWARVPAKGSGRPDHGRRAAGTARPTEEVSNAKESATTSESGRRSGTEGRSVRPTNYVFTPLAFPAKYQKALYICDWTFGTMYAIHMEPHQSSYRATKEEFVSRSPLPLTDVAAGPDGALYFSVGGRGTHSELFRVVYLGDESTSPLVPSSDSLTSAAQDRKILESRPASQTYDKPEEWFKDNSFQKSFVTPYLASTDPFLRFAAIRQREKFVAAQMQTSLRENRKTVAAGGKLKVPTGPQALLTPEKFAPPSVIIGDWLANARNAALLRQVHALPWPDDETPPPLESVISDLPLAKFPLNALSVTDRLSYLRMLSLVFIRIAPPSENARDRLLHQLDRAFPADDPRLNRELCQMLVYLDSPSVVAKTIALMNQPPQREDIDMTDLLARNAGYGKAIKAMIDNQPDKQQMWYAFCLRVAKVGWTPELRSDYYRWFGRAQTWSGGNSYKKFLQNIENEAWDITPFDHRVLVEAAGARTPYKVPELPKPTGPGQDWTLDEVRALAADGLKNRNFENGQKMFAATRCIVCHRFAGDGGATGPDLTQLAGRFNIEALTEAIVDPSKVISDQYKGSTVVTSDGKTINGRIVSENDEQISVLTDPEDSTKIVDIPKSDIDETLPSKVSIMPADLLKPLNKDEVLDLLAYLLSRGDEKHPMFRQ